MEMAKTDWEMERLKMMKMNQKGEEDVRETVRRNTHTTPCIRQSDNELHLSSLQHHHLVKKA